jgi:hypothetical protein
MSSPKVGLSQDVKMPQACIAEELTTKHMFSPRNKKAAGFLTKPGCFDRDFTAHFALRHVHILAS